MESRQELNRQLAVAHQSALWTERELHKALTEMIRLENDPNYLLLEDEYSNAVSRYYYLCSKALLERKTFVGLVKKMINLE